MAKKPTSNATSFNASTPAQPVKKTVPPAPAAKAAAPVVSAVRNSPIPKVVAAVPAPAAKKQITHDQIARRAFEISLSPSGGSEMANWLKAESELRG